MKRATTLAAFSIAVIAATSLAAQEPDETPQPPRAHPMSRRAAGLFDVKVAPVDQKAHEDGITLGRFSLDKSYHGALEATATGEMLTAAGAVKGAAGYVAVERVEGTLDGRRGSFALQHLGQMSAAGQSLTILVVPGSGSGELAGLEGRLEITFGDGGAHFYALEYSLPESP